MLEEEIKLTADSSQAEKELDKLAEKTKDINKNQQQEQTQELISVKDNFKTLTDAIKDLSKVTKHDIDYKDGNAAYYLAQSYNKNGQLDKAKKYYKYVIENYPGSQRARTSMNYVDAQE